LNQRLSRVGGARLSALAGVPLPKKRDQQSQQVVSRETRQQMTRVFRTLLAVLSNGGLE
jgi:hypothetical protein